VAIQDWPVCLKDTFPGYIDWGEFMANHQRLAFASSSGAIVRSPFGCEPRSI
jgi:hypothetical protein